MERAIELRLPPDPQFSRLAAHVVGEAAARAGLPDGAREQLQQATSLAFDLILGEAMCEECEAIGIRASWTPADVCVSIRERGMPLDATAVAQDPRWQGILDRVERAQWKLHGRRGTELLLAVRRPHGVGPASEETLQTAPVPPAPEQNYTVRRFVSGDAAGVARAFFHTWGYRYIFPAVYVPDRLTQLNASNEYISIVAVAENGDIVGHYALDPIPDAPIADACAAIVVPAHRGRGLLERLRAAAEDEAIRLGFAAYYSEPVTAHGRTQSESMKFGARLCAIVLGGDPSSFVPKQMAISGAGQRQSFTVYFKPLQNREARTVYAPQRHRQIIDAIYDNLELSVLHEQPGEAVRDEREEGDVHVNIVRSEGYASIDVLATGRATPEQLLQAISDVRRVTHLGAIYVNLPLEEPAAAHLCEIIERVGFFFCGVIPWSMGGRDSLRMQLPLRPIDLSGVTIVGAFGETLKTYIGAQMDQSRIPATSPRSG